MLLLISTVLGCQKPHKKEAPAADPPAPTSAPTQATTPPPIQAPTPDPVATDRPPAPGGETTLHVYTQQRLHSAVKELARKYKETQDGLDIVVRSAGLHEALRSMGEDGGDVVVVEGYTALAVVQAAGVVSTADVRTPTYLPITVTVAGPKADKVKALADLDTAGFKLGIADPQRSTGAEAARRLIRRAGFTGKFQERVLPSGAATALKDGTVDAFIGWGRAGAGVPLTVPVGLREHLPVPAAVTTITKHGDQARAFLAFLVSEDAQRVWEAAGTSPTPARAAPILPTLLPIRLPQPRRNAGAVIVGERVLLAGGESAGELLKALTWLDPGQMRVHDSNATLRAGLEGAAVEHVTGSGHVIIAGGRTAAGPVREIQRYDIAADQVELLTIELPLPQWGAASAIAGQVIYTFGGRGKADALLDVVCRVDMATGEVSELKGLPAPVTELAAASGPGDAVWLFGGHNQQGPTSEILEFDPATGTTKVHTYRLTEPLAGAVVTRWEDGWLIAGGRTHNGPRDRIELLAADGAAKRLSDRLPYPITSATGLALRNKLLIMGGLSDTRVEARIVRFPY